MPHADVLARLALVAAHPPSGAENRGRTDPLVHKLVRKIISVGEAPVSKGAMASYALLYRQIRQQR